MDKQSYFVKFLSTAPVITTIWLFITAGILIEFNRFFPDLLFHPMP
ncbi:photosystem I reaction center subunit IX [Calothrix sp. 336/3]|nr:photosystem I reaction center subunit IX [Calothrix sp. 336/3]AKG23420.1 photosystem I reaction center subunit IX [Calothrix sp. 336/3]